MFLQHQEVEQSGTLAIGAKLRLKGGKDALMRQIAGRTRYPGVFLTMKPSDWETRIGRKKRRICV